MWSNAAVRYPAPNKVNAYLNTKVTSATPEQLMLMAYDVAIVNCQKKDSQKASLALTELIGSLNFEYEEIALGLFRLYQYCLNLVKKQQFDEPYTLLKELKESWELALCKQKGS